MNIASSPQQTRTSLISFLSAVVDVYARDKNLDICRSFARLGIGPRNHKVVPQVGSAKLVYDSTIGFMVDSDIPLICILIKHGNENSTTNGRFTGKFIANMGDDATYIP